MELIIDTFIVAGQSVDALSATCDAAKVSAIVVSHSRQIPLECVIFWWWPSLHT